MRIRRNKKKRPLVFISYSRADEQIACDLASVLDELNIPYFLDVVDIEPGAPWDRTIQDALMHAKHLVLIHTIHSFKSDNVWDEWSFFRSTGKSIIPLKFDQSVLPYRLMRYQYIDFTGDNVDDALISLVSRLINIDFGQNLEETQELSPYIDDDETQPLDSHDDFYDEDDDDETQPLDSHDDFYDEDDDDDRNANVS